MASPNHPISDFQQRIGGNIQDYLNCRPKNLI
jgi:hypothetical protein